MILAALIALTSTQCPPYLQARADAGAPGSPCLTWKDSAALVFRVNDQGNPENGGAEVTAAAAAIATWQQALSACSSVSMAAGARTPSRQTANDGENVVLWRFKRCADVVAASDPCWADEACANAFDCWEHTDAPLALAITTTWFAPSTGRLLDADIELNWPSFLFTTVDAPVCVAPAVTLACVATDVQNTMTHELGHALGLAHDCSRASTMYFRAELGELSKRTLDLGSTLFACEVYPKGAASPGCARAPDGTALSVPRRGCGCDSAPASGLLAILWYRRRDANRAGGAAARRSAEGRV